MPWSKPGRWAAPLGTLAFRAERWIDGCMKSRPCAKVYPCPGPVAPTARTVPTPTNTEIARLWAAGFAWDSGLLMARDVYGGGNWYSLPDALRLADQDHGSPYLDGRPRDSADTKN